MRATTTQRGYGYDHQKRRNQAKTLVDSGQAQCWRCGQPIHPHQPWDLGHDDNDRTITRGPEHALAAHCPAGGNRASNSNNRKPPQRWNL